MGQPGLFDSVAEGVFDEAIRHDEAENFLKDPSHIMMNGRRWWSAWQAVR